MGYLLRRSSIACNHVIKCLGWRPDMLIQVGVGPFWKTEEADEFTREYPGIKIVGFEPHPGIAKEARENGYPGELREKAIANFVGRWELTFSKHHVGGASLYQAKEDHERVRVDVSTLDYEFHDRPVEGNILLWLDCEGSERDALRGASGLIQYVDVVNVELTENPPSTEWCQPYEVHNLLVDKGFRRQHVHTHRVTAGQYDGVYVKKCLYNQRYSCDPF